MYADAFRDPEVTAQLMAAEYEAVVGFQGNATLRGGHA
jgi:hypothetical protein